jgi:RNA polymerase sigma-70 factor (ECF subfamily)
MESVAVPLDSVSQAWIDGLRSAHPRHGEHVTALRDLLLKGARHELGRRRSSMGGLAGPELDDLAHQAAADALLAVISKLDTFRGASRFTTWAYKFVMFEVSAKAARHVNRTRQLVDDVDWGTLPERVDLQPAEQSELAELLRAIEHAVATDLTPHQRAVFLAVAINGESADVIGLRLGSNRNAIYKTLFDARKKLRTSLIASGHLAGTGTDTP